MRSNDTKLGQKRFRQPSGIRRVNSTFSPNKFTEPFDSLFSGTANNKSTVSFDDNATLIIPPFNCVNDQCRFKLVDTSKDPRYHIDNGPAASSLIIEDPKPEDRGLYRCSALTKLVMKNQPLETIYQVVKY